MGSSNSGLANPYPAFRVRGLFLYSTYPLHGLDDPFDFVAQRLESRIVKSLKGTSRKLLARECDVPLAFTDVRNRDRIQCVSHD